MNTTTDGRAHAQATVLYTFVRDLREHGFLQRGIRTARAAREREDHARIIFLHVSDFIPEEELYVIEHLRPTAVNVWRRRWSIEAYARNTL